MLRSRKFASSKYGGAKRPSNFNSTGKGRSSGKSHSNCHGNKQVYNGIILNCPLCRTEGKVHFDYENGHMATIICSNQDCILHCIPLLNKDWNTRITECPNYKCPDRNTGMCVNCQYEPAPENSDNPEERICKTCLFESKQCDEYPCNNCDICDIPLMHSK